MTRTKFFDPAKTAEIAAELKTFWKELEAAVDIEVLEFGQEGWRDNHNEKRDAVKAVLAKYKHLAIYIDYDDDNDEERRFAEDGSKGLDQLRRF